MNMPLHQSPYLCDALPGEGNPLRKHLMDDNPEASHRSQFEVSTIEVCAEQASGEEYV